VEDSVEIKPPVEKLEMVRHMGTDKLTKRIRGEDGKYKKQPKTMPKSEDMTRYLRNVLNRAEANADGTITRGSKSRISRMISNIIKNAEMDAEQPARDRLGNPLTDEDGKVIKVVDPKIMMASAQNLKELMLRAYGAPGKSDEELNAMKMQKVNVVIITPPAEFMNKEVKEEKPREQIEPAFLDAEIVENKV
jgi:cellobiose-specific phosphotransferase system component IIB